MPAVDDEGKRGEEVATAADWRRRWQANRIRPQTTAPSSQPRIRNESQKRQPSILQSEPPDVHLHLYTYTRIQCVLYTVSMLLCCLNSAFVDGDKVVADKLTIAVALPDGFFTLRAESRTRPGLEQHNGSSRSQPEGFHISIFFQYFPLQKSMS